MSSQPVVDFLTKEMSVNHSVVTFRLLSRQFAIHITKAKQELAQFLELHRKELGLHPTYLVSGDISPLECDEMDDDDYEDSAGRDVVARSRMVMVTEDRLEVAKASFARVRSCHIYSLSPAPLKDAGLVCGAADRVREFDLTKGSDFQKSVGKIISPAVKLAGKITAKQIPFTAASTTKASTTITSTEAKKQIPPNATASSSSKPTLGGPKKAAATLDWSKAKTKADKVKPEPAGKSTPDSSKSKPAESKGIKIEQKRGTKRKSDVMAQPDPQIVARTPEASIKAESPAPSRPPSSRASSVKPSPSETSSDAGVKPSTSEAKLRKGVVVSDDDEPAVKSTAKLKIKVRAPSIDSEAEKSLRAMMDVDDDEVERVRIKAKPQKEEAKVAESPPTRNETADNSEAASRPQSDVEMDNDSDPAPKAKPRKRKPKKVVPVGRNGLKKKRVVVSKTRMENGYIVTEDVSEYESVEEEEAEAEKADKPKVTKPAAKEKKTAKAPTKAKEQSNTASSSKDQPKKLSRMSSVDSLGKKGGNSLMNYWGGGSKSKK